MGIRKEAIDGKDTAGFVNEVVVVKTGVGGVVKAKWHSDGYIALIYAK